MSDEHQLSNLYECPRCRSGKLMKLSDAPLTVDKKFRCGYCGFEPQLDTYPKIRSTGWGSNYEERN